MSFIVYRDIFGMEQNDELLTEIDKLDDEVIKRYQQGWVDDEFSPGWTIQEAEEYYRNRGGIGTPFPEPSSFDTLLILYKMIENGEISFVPEKGDNV